MRVKKITKRWLVKHGADCDGLKWFESLNETDIDKLYEIVMSTSMVNINVLFYALWCLYHLLNAKQNAMVLIFSYEEGLNFMNSDCDINVIIERIKLGKKYIKRQSYKNKKAFVTDLPTIKLNANHCIIVYKKVLEYGYKLLKEQT